MKNNENTIKENLEQKSVGELPENELAGVCGGTLDIDSVKPECSACGSKLDFTKSNQQERYDLFKCSKCGTLFKHTWRENEWFLY